MTMIASAATTRENVLSLGFLTRLRFLLLMAPRRLACLWAVAFTEVRFPRMGLLLDWLALVRVLPARDLYEVLDPREGRCAALAPDRALLRVRYCVLLLLRFICFCLRGL